MKYTKPLLKYRIRTMQLADISDILTLFDEEVKAGRMLPRNKEDMRANIKDWRVASILDEIIGCVSLVFFNETLCEIRSLAVTEAHRKNGLGKKLIKAALALAKERGVENVLTLTRVPRLFEHLGFQKNEIQNFPDKVQQDCQPCLFINCCDEVALLYQIKESEDI
ncbi:MAG: GNAT family N-acetyltransferase [Anaerolineales bacterium]